MDSDPSMTKNPPKDPGRPWSCVPSRSGLFVHDARDRGYFLPTSRREKETVLPQPPLAMTLSTAEVQDLMRVERPYATTRYGPEVQEKASNQDFALSALIEDGGGGRWCFGAVADGVSTATFWPERASRLACLASFSYFRESLGHRSGVDLDDRTLLDLKRGLVTTLRTSLVGDRRKLRSHTTPTPPTFAPQEYRRRWDNDELWYKTTLLVGLMGPKHGLVFWSGDGGIWLRRQGGAGPVVKQVLASADGPLQSYVWLGVQEKDLSVGKIVLDDHEEATLALASDGLHRTLQLAEMSYETLLPPGAVGPRRRRLESSLEHLYRAEGGRRGTQAEPDNASLVVLEWTRGQRFTGDRKLLEEFALAEVLAPPAADPPLSESEPMTPGKSPATAPLPGAGRSPAPAGPLQGSPPKPPLQRGTEPSPPLPARKETYAAQHRSRTLPVVLSIGIAFIVVGLLAWLGSNRLLSTNSSEADEAGDEGQVDAPLAASQARASPAAPAPAGSLGVSPADPQNPAKGPVQATTSGRVPIGPLEFTVLEPGSLLLKAVGPPSQESAAALVRELAEWSKQAWLLSGSEESPAVTVVAYGDRSNPTLDGCLANEKVARDRAKLFAELLQLLTPGITVNAAWNVCEAPPGISNPSSAEARRLVLFPGHQELDCDCNDVSWAK